MKKTVLIYGTWKQRTHAQNVCVFQAHNVPYEETVHERVFRLEDGTKEVWRFRQIKALVTPEEEASIRKEMARIRKFQS